MDKLFQRIPVLDSHDGYYEAVQSAQSSKAKGRSSLSVWFIEFVESMETGDAIETGRDSWRQAGFVEFVELVEFIEFIETGDAIETGRDTVEIH
jgi:hypothetical protein